MTSYASAGPFNGHCYQLTTLAHEGKKETTEYFETLEDLAHATYVAMSLRAQREFGFYYAKPNARTDHWVRTHLRAYSYRGNALDVLVLSRCGQYCNPRYRGRWWSAMNDGYVRRQGNVPGIHKYRGGSSVRNCQTMNERRLNGAVFVEDGEVGCRAVRRDGYLYNSWDGRPRSTERCWKDQRKGRKSWDRG